MAKAKVVFTVGRDAYKVAQNIWKAISGSAHVKRIPSNSAAAKNAKNLSSTNAAKTKINLARLKLGLQRRQSADALRKLNRESKVKLKKGPLDASTKTGTAGSRTSGTGSRTSGTGGAKKTGPWSTSKTSSSTQAQKLRDADVTKSTKINLKNATVGQNVYKAGKKAGNVVREGGKKFIKTNKGNLIALTAATAGVGGYYIGKKIDESIAGTSGTATTSSGAATTTKPPKPSKPVTTAPAPPSQLPSSPNGKKPKPQQSGPSGGPPQRSAIKAKPKSYEQKLKDKFIKDRGGIDAFKPTTKWGKYWKGDKSVKDITDSAWNTHLLNMREGHEAGLTFTDQQKYDKVMAERKELSEKKHGGQVRKKKKKAAKKRPRGVGKALRGYGKASYSSKMY